MAKKKNVQSMTPEELAAYVESVRQRNASNAKKYYNEKIKTDPEKYTKFLQKSYEMAPFLMTLDRDTERSPRTRVSAVIARR
jgi:hypothetical protein